VCVVGSLNKIKVQSECGKLCYILELNGYTNNIKTQNTHLHILRLGVKQRLV